MSPAISKSNDMKNSEHAQNMHENYQSVKASQIVQNCLTMGKRVRKTYFANENNEDNEAILIIPHGAYEINVAQYIYELIVLAVPQKRITDREGGPIYYIKDFATDVRSRAGQPP